MYSTFTLYTGCAQPCHGGCIAVYTFIAKFLAVCNIAK